MKLASKLLYLLNERELSDSDQARVDALSKKVEAFFDSVMKKNKAEVDVKKKSGTHYEFSAHPQSAAEIKALRMKTFKAFKKEFSQSGFSLEEKNRFDSKVYNLYISEVRGSRFGLAFEAGFKGNK